MTANQQLYLYSVNCQQNEKELRSLEIKSLFGNSTEGKIVISEKEFDPAISPFLKKRMDIEHSTPSFQDLLDRLQKAGIVMDDFKVEYVKSSGTDPFYEKRAELVREIGYRIQGFPSFSAPAITLGLTFYNGLWYYGPLKKNNLKWYAHKSKPCSYSNSLDINLAKALVNIAGNGDFSRKIIDPCCGVGTVLLEGLFAGYDIEGRDINRKIADDARKNLEHFGFPPRVQCRAIHDIRETFSASIIDLPYGHFTRTSEERQIDIIRNAGRISPRVVIVSAKDASGLISREGLKVSDFCTVRKNRKGGFSRHIWVCTE